MIQFLADKVRISGPKVDGSTSVTFEVGEYEQSKVAELLKMPHDVILKVSVEVEG